MFVCVGRVSVDHQVLRDWKEQEDRLDSEDRLVRTLRQEHSFTLHIRSLVFQKFTGNNILNKISVKCHILGRWLVCSFSSFLMTKLTKYPLRTRRNIGMILNLVLVHPCGLPSSLNLVTFIRTKDWSLWWLDENCLYCILPEPRCEHLMSTSGDQSNRVQLQVKSRRNMDFFGTNRFILAGNDVMGLTKDIFRHDLFWHLVLSTCSLRIRNVYCGYNETSLCFKCSSWKQQILSLFGSDRAALCLYPRYEGGARTTWFHWPKGNSRTIWETR